MPTDRLTGPEIPKHLDPYKAYGANLDPGPYIGWVKNNTDPARAGRVQVWIPEFGGKENEQSSWITVGYASPYMGAVRWPREKAEKSDANKYNKVNHSYGMWMTPPDIGNQVLVIFIGGDGNRGYYFASVFQEHTHYAVPGIAGTNYLTGETTVDPALRKYLDCPPYPSVEFNEVNKGLHKEWNNFLTIKKPAHEEQNLQLLRQGLEDDKIRGVISSSSQRESPSRVFGISTPGRPSPKDMPKEELNKVKGPEYRLGGHQFIMDDGDAKDKNQMIRLRTARGHQIMLSDSEDPKKSFINVGNAEGTAWFEMTADGQIQFYAENAISFRTKKDMNMFVEGEFNMQTKLNTNLSSNGSIVMQCDQITGLAKTEIHFHSQNVAGFKADKHLYLQSGLTTHARVGTELVISASKDITIKTNTSLKTQSIKETTFLAGTDLKGTAAKRIDLKSGTALALQSGVSTSINSAGDITTQSKGNTTHLAGGVILETASQIHMNGPKAPAAAAAIAAKGVGLAKWHSIPAKMLPITHREVSATAKAPYFKWKPKSTFVSYIPLIPKHEPSNSRDLCCGPSKNGTGGVEKGPIYVLLDKKATEPKPTPPPPVGKAPWNSEKW